MSEVQINKPLSLNFDKSPSSLSETEAFFLRNHERSLNNGNFKTGSIGDTTPVIANYKACEMNKPLGKNYAKDGYWSELTGEMYTWVYNTNGVHYIQRINSSGECQVVYFGCLSLSADPKHTINQFRAYMSLEKICANRHGKSLIWTNGDGHIGCIDVEASIATNNFTTPFFNICNPNPCELINLCVPDPCGCLIGEFVPLSTSDRGKKNNIVDAGFKFSYRHIYYDGRTSEWANPSTLFYQDTRGCFENNDSLPRCIKLRVPVGNPLVDKIEIAYSKDGIWYSAEVVDKYKKYNSSQQFWYERSIGELSNFSESDCSFDYYFCNDKQCQIVDPKEFTRVYNPYPIKPQGILPIGIGEDKTAIGYYNYEQGNCPIDKTSIEKFKFDVNCTTSSCKPEYATIKVRAIIHNRGVQRNQFIYRMGGENNSPDDTTDTAFFGGLNQALSGGIEIGYDQYFREKTRNFIVYIEGTETYAEMKQYKSHAFFRNNGELRGVLPNLDDVNRRNRWRRAIRNGEFFYQEAEIKVIKGTKGFLRLASHHAVGLESDSSTFVKGTQNLLVYKGDLNTGEGFTDNVEEIYFDTCNGDLDLTTAFMIDDNAVDSGLSSKASAYNGYVKDKNSRPVEGAIVECNGVECVTDHNGFYHFYLDPGEDSAVNVNVKVEQDCFNFTTVKTESIQGAKGENISHDITIDNETYSNGFYSTVLANVQDCEGYPVGGIIVALSGSKSDITDPSGTARFRIRNYESRDRQLRMVVMDKNGCISTDCNGNCNPCMVSNTSSAPSCFFTKPTISFANSVINRKSIFQRSRGLKSGGRYPFGFVVKGDCGYISAVNEVKYLDIPRIQQRNGEGFCTFSYDATGVTLPSWAKCVHIVRGENVNPFELQWLVDKIERVDGKLMLTIQSLNDYNEKYFFKTNTVYQWLKGDRIEFIKNGDGKIFDIATYGLLNYLTISPFHDELVSGKTSADANYFNQILIDDDGKLDSLKEGALIELQRVKDCTTDPVYFSICASLEVEDGSIVYPVGVFTTFDTYYVNRKVGKFVSQRFEHHSPSDFWGEKLTDAGKPYFVNKYENKRRYGRNITIAAPNQINYFGDSVKKFDPDIHGDIIAMYVRDNKIGICISEFDNSIFEVSDDLLRVDASGVVRASTPDQIIGESQPKVIGKYGCSYENIGGVVAGDGFVTWLDVDYGDLIKHDYSRAVPVGEGKVQSYFRSVCQNIKKSQSSSATDINKLRVISGINYISGVVYVTVKKLSDSGINNTYNLFEKENDTIVFDPKSNEFTQMVSFTPESYGVLKLSNENGCSFVSYLNGIPYIHPIVFDKFNEFYGVAVDRFIGVFVNKFPNKNKVPIALEIQDSKMWFVKRVFTENANFVSEIPPAKFKKTGEKWNASFLRNVNSPGGLFNGGQANGRFIGVVFVRDNTDSLKYNTINDSKRVLYSSLDMIIFKFIFSEQSGFTENL